MIAAEVSIYETIERVESILRNEGTENAQEISVLTDNLTWKQKLNISLQNMYFLTVFVYFEFLF